MRHLVDEHLDEELLEQEEILFTDDTLSFYQDQLRQLLIGFDNLMDQLEASLADKKSNNLDSGF
ncbi:MAG: hypothetical protein LBV80_10655 [Deltaproteobacteria bacterium]|jgi:adenine/guanine phosphoribosyltransferase-like PRPP-binding protein|nr:hypothetical protein [Deltaproteobacteria bacterium]